jgi:hypothetical protein
VDELSHCVSTLCDASKQQWLVELCCGARRCQCCHPRAAGRVSVKYGRR